MRGFSIVKATLGMSLIEVTIALVIMGIVGISLLSLFVNGRTSTAAAEREVTAVNLAQGKLEEIKSTPYSRIPVGSWGGSFASVSGYTYRVHVGVSEHNTKTVTVAVYYGDEEREIVRLTTDVAKR